MKKMVFVLCSVLFTAWLSAQEPADALRYSWVVPGGTARQQAIGGAMGSLGGDVSATFTNPAGLAFYRTGDFVLSPAYHFGNNKSTYFNRTESGKNNQFNVGTTGFVWGGSGAGRNIRGSAFSIAFNRTADFNSTILYRGVNNQSSYSQKFLDELKNDNVTDPNQVGNNTGYAYGTDLAFRTYWIDTVQSSAGKFAGFQTRAPIASGLIQENLIQSTGGINEFAFGAAVNLNNRLMLGGSLGVPILSYDRNLTYTEASASSSIPNFNYASFSDHLNTKGVGLNLRAGLIYQLQESIRLGLAVHSPTIYNLTDLYNTSVTTDTKGYQGVNSQSSDNVVGDVSQFRYTFITPYRIIASASYVISQVEDVTKQKGFLTADVEYVNYKASSFQPDAQSDNDQSTIDYLKTLNGAIDKAYKSSLNVRVGGELKFTTLMVRAGAAYYGNPYNNINGETGHKLNLSGGLGYRNKGMFVDLAYIQSLNKDVNFPYRLQSAPYFGAHINSSVGNVLMTVGLKF